MLFVFPSCQNWNQPYAGAPAEFYTVKLKLLSCLAILVNTGSNCLADGSL
jgi:hypothetical protein